MNIVLYWWPGTAWPHNKQTHEQNASPKIVIYGNMCDFKVSDAIRLYAMFVWTNITLKQSQGMHKLKKLFANYLCLLKHDCSQHVIQIFTLWFRTPHFFVFRQALSVLHMRNLYNWVLNANNIGVFLFVFDYFRWKIHKIRFMFGLLSFSLIRTEHFFLKCASAVIRRVYLLNPNLKSSRIFNVKSKIHEIVQQNGKDGERYLPIKSCICSRYILAYCRKMKIKFNVHTYWSSSHKRFDVSFRYCGFCQLNVA